MLIKDVCKECKLTKKAVEYYEKQGLIHPQIGENNYRIYTQKEIGVLKEISVLRKIGVSIADIKTVLESNNKKAALSKCKYRMELDLEKKAAQYKCFEHLIMNYDIDSECEYIDNNINKFFTVKEKLLQAFPGTYGMYLSVHFGQFLHERIDNAEKEEAYEKVVQFLDSIDNLEFSSQLEDYFENCFSDMQKADMEKMSRAMYEAVDRIQDYIEENRAVLEKYIEIRRSDDYKATPAYKMQQQLLDFQKSSGYYDMFIPNIKILSTAYRQYCEKIEAANKVVVEKYPELGRG